MWQKNEAGEMELDLRDLVRVLLSRIHLILAAVCLGGLILFLYTYFLVTPMYTASTSLYVSNDQRSEAITSSDISVSKSLVETYIVILQSDTLLSKVSKTMSASYTPQQLRSMMTASAINGTEAFRINIRHENPTEAQTIANTIAMVAPDEIIRVVKAGAVETIDYASLPTDSDWPIARNTAIGALLGLVISCVVVVIIGMTDTVIYTEDDLSSAYNLPILGTIPHIEPITDAGASTKSSEMHASKEGVVT